MDSEQIVQYYHTFEKYWKEALERKNISDFQTAESILNKILPEIENLFNSDEYKKDLAKVYNSFCEFYFDYYLLKGQNQVPQNHELSQLKTIAEKTISIDPDNFDGHYYRVVYLSTRLSTANAGPGSVLYHGEEFADSAIGTAFNIVGKGLRLGATATKAGISKANFTNEIWALIETFQKVSNLLNDAYVFINNSLKMFNIAEYCDDIGYNIARDIYKAVRNVNISQLDYSSYKEEYQQDAKDDATQMHIVADAKA